MAIGDTVYTPQVPLGSLLSFDSKSCGDYCLILGNAPYCTDNVVTNHLFLGNFGVDWSLERTTTIESYGPATIKESPVGTPGVSQQITLAKGDYVVFYSFTNSTLNGNWSGTVDFAAASTTLFTNSGNATEKGAVAVSVAWALGFGNLSANFTMADADDEVELNYLFVCPANGWIPDTNYCFQLPLFETGSELLGLTDNEIDLTEEFNYTTDQTVNRSSSIGTCGVTPPSDDYINIATFAGTTVAQDTGLFHIISLGSTTIDWGLNIDDDVSKKLSLRVYDEGGASAAQTQYDTIDFTANDADSDLFVSGTSTWYTGGYLVEPPADNPDGNLQLSIVGTTECDGTNERIVYNVTVTNWRAIAKNYSTTFTATDDTFYRLRYKLNKCSSTSAQINDSASTTIFQASSDGVYFDKIFKTGSLPVDKTITVIFTVEDLLDYPNANFEIDVLTEVVLYKMCDWNADLEDSNENTISAFTETHGTNVETVGSAYHPNIEYCLDMATVPAGCYQVRATDQCNTDRQKVGNCIKVCDGDPKLSQIAWTPAEVVCAGEEVIDYVEYPSTTFFWTQVDFQDMTIERDREFYRRADGYWETPFTYQHQIEIMQIWPVPPFVRHALSIGMAGTFSVDGVDYQVINDDDISPLFNATYESPIRIPVHKVGNFTLRRS